MKTSSRVYKQLLNEDRYFVEWGAIDRQCCCDCGLVHDVTYKLRRGGVEIFIRRNERSTKNRRRANTKEKLATTHNTAMQAKRNSKCKKSAQTERRCSTCGRFNECGKTGWLEIHNCDGWRSASA